MTELLAAAIKRRHHALWVDVRFITPFGFHEWAVCVHPLNGDEFELARSRWRLAALVKAWRRPASVRPHEGTS